MASSKRKIKALMGEELSNPDSDEQFLREFAEAIVESIQEAPQVKESDPFDLYTWKVRSSIYHDPQAFCSRFSKGYYSLLNAISKKKS